MSAATEPADDQQGVLAAEMAVEQSYVDRVYARVAQLHSNADALAAEGRGRATLGKHIYSALFERDALVYQAARRSADLDAAHEGLIFGRLDLDDGDVRYVGRIGLRDEEYEPLAIDWRAPAAAPFYRATARERHGVIRRRVIDCRRERVVGIDDDLLAPESAPDGMNVIGDGALMAALSRARSGAMRDIVATIQAEQDEIIRASPDGATLITGGPGTGKTAVALHRAAYLLYVDRRRFERGGVLIVGPSAAFMRFIERVLPSLGETAATLRSTGNLVDGLDGSHVDEPRTAYLKGSLAMRPVLRRAVAMPPPDAPDELRLTAHGTVLRVEAAELAEVRRQLLTRERRPNVARGQAASALLARLWQRLSSGGIGPSELTEAEFIAELADRGEVTDFVADWWPVTDGPSLLATLHDPDRLGACAGKDLQRDDVAALAATFEPLAAGGGPSVADVALIDELITMLGRPAFVDAPDPSKDADAEWESQAEADAAFGTGAAVATPLGLFPDPDDTEFAHIVVDEAQDLSPMQWRVLGRRGRRASWTIVGDPLQSSWSDTGEAERAMGEALRRSERREYRLDVNYRNSEEIFAVAARVIRLANPHATLPRAVRATGHHPRERQVLPESLADAVRAAAAEILDEVEGDVGVIVPISLRAAVVGWLQPAGAGRVRVIESLEAKGLEYDGVIVVEPSRIAAQVSRGDHLLYVALTRATQRLTVLTTDADWLDRLVAG